MAKTPVRKMKFQVLNLAKIWSTRAQPKNYLMAAPYFFKHCGYCFKTKVTYNLAIMVSCNGFQMWIVTILTTNRIKAGMPVSKKCVYEDKSIQHLGQKILIINSKRNWWMFKKVKNDSWSQNICICEDDFFSFMDVKVKPFLNCQF